jgi:long-subunit fatty acid transport protein
MKVDGTGIGAKLGIVIRPIEALRIGLAVHTPTYYSMVYTYSASLSSAALSAGDNPYGWDVINGYVYADEYTPILKDHGEDRWDFTSPTRLLAGISYAIGPYAIISADYEYSAYRALGWDGTPTDTGYSNATIHSSLKGTHSVRGGIEAKPAPWLSLRVGGGFRSSVLNSNYDIVAFSEPVADKLWYASAGLGFRLGQVTSIDVAYQYRNTRYSDYYTFRTQLGNTPNESPLYGLDILNHNVAVTFAFRF